MKTRKKYILAKIESTYGTDPTPDAASAILTYNLQREIYAGPTVEREFDRASLGANPRIATAPMVTSSFGVELAGSGTAGDAPAFGPLLRACGFSETLDAGVDAVYAPVSESYESITQYYDRDGERQIATGMRGNLQLQLAAGQIPMMNYSMTGLYAKPAAQTLVTPDVSAFQVPEPVNFANTVTATLGVYDLQLQSLDVDMGNEVPHLNLVNYEEVLITNRVVTGTMTILAPLVSTKDIFALVESHSGISTDAFQLVHGDTGGNIVTLDAPKLQLTGITEVDINGEQGYQIPFVALPDSGDDELTLTFS